MGISNSIGIADSLFTTVQQRVLAILFGQPQRRFQSAELIRLARSGTGAAHRELKRLSASGLISVSPIGSQKFYQANHDSPVFPELHRLVVKTVGLQVPLAEALEPFSDRIVAAFVFGSFAKGKETTRSDVDLMILANEVEYADLYQALEGTEKILHRTINPHLMAPSAWRRKMRTPKRNPFVVKVASQPKMFVLGTENELG